MAGVGTPIIGETSTPFRGPSTERTYTLNREEPDLSEDGRITIVDGVRSGRSARAIAAEVGRAVSTVMRELQPR
jgi:transposase, IS30 family